MTLDARGSLRAPLEALRAARVARTAAAWRPDFIYCWNGAGIPQSALRILADTAVPLAFRVEEHWFGRLFLDDQFLRELLPAERGPGRTVWAWGCRALNAASSLHMKPTAPLRAAVTWNSEAMRRMAPPPYFVDAVLERVLYPAPPRGDLYAEIRRAPAPVPSIAYLGRVSPEKGVGVAIEALALLRDRLGQPVSLDVVGPEEPGHGADLRRLADRLGVGEAVHWHGSQPPEEVAGVLSRSHALIVPSTWDEPFGYVMVEGALARVPLVASDVGGISEAMHGGEHALLFQRGDAEAAASALLSTLRDTEQTAARVERAHARAQAFRTGAYLQAQEQFVADALDALTPS